MKNSEMVILVDPQDFEIGSMEKLEAHKKGKLHRAISVFLFNDKKELLLQKRALSKYHSGGLWSNTCCSHPRPVEETLAAAERRLREEMGIVAPLCKVCHFTYCVPLNNALIEHELDHIFVGLFNGIPVLNPEEADEWKWVKWDVLQKQVEDNPELYTPWLKLILHTYCRNLPDHPSLVRSVEK